MQVRLSILLPVHVDDRKLSLTLPTTLTPRYANAARPAPEITAAHILPKELIRGPRLNLKAVIGPDLDTNKISSPSHQLAVIDGTISLNDVTMDRDVVLEWPFPAAVMKGGIADAVVVATHKGVSYTQVLMAPPAPATRADDLRLSRELFLVIDTSGSMAGDAIDAAREAALNALDGLQPGDRFEVIEFDDRTRSLFGSPAEADDRNLRIARRFIQRLEADGGTEMAPALARALIHEGDDTAATTVRQVVFLTDGSITDERALLQQISRDIGTKRLFTVGIGQAPNAWFLHKAASIGGGTALTLRDVDAVENRVTRDTAAAHEVAVPNVIPAGNTMLAIAMPQGAAGIHTLAWLGALTGFLGAFFVRLGRRSRLSPAR